MKITKKIELILVFTIASLSAWIVYVQSLKFTPLIDYSYQIENAYRMYLGEFPYRDFWLVLPPGVYWMLAVMMKISGGYAHWIPITFMCGMSFFIVILTYAVLLRLRINPVLMFVLLTLLLSAGHAIMLAPNYDVATGAAIMVSVLWFELL